MWKNFLGKKSKIIGVDENPKCKYFEKYGFTIEIGDQASEIFWDKFYKMYFLNPNLVLLLRTMKQVTI